MKATNSLGSSELAWAGSRAAMGTTPSRSYANYSAGYVFGRTGWSKSDFEDGIFYSVRFGPSYDLTPHGQRDAGSITLTRGNSEYLFESGRYRYDKSSETQYLNSAKAHSTVGFANSEEFDQISMECIRQVTAPHFDWTSLHRSLSGDGFWNRSILHLRELKCLIVIDDVVSDDELTIDQNWQLDAMSTCTTGNNSLISSSESHDYSLNFQWFSATEASIEIHSGQSEPLQGWRSVEHGVIFAAPAITSSFRGDHIRIVTILNFLENDAINSPENVRVSSNIGIDNNASSGKVDTFITVTEGPTGFDIIIPKIDELQERDPVVTRAS